MNLVLLAVNINFLGIVFDSKIPFATSINLPDSTEKKKAKS